MTIPETLPTLLAELDRLRIPVISCTFDPGCITVETANAFWGKDPADLGDTSSAVEWAQIIAAQDGGVSA